MQIASEVCKDSQWFLYYHYSIRYVQYFSKKFGILMDRVSYLDVNLINKGNNKITELRTILQRESQNS